MGLSFWEILVIVGVVVLLFGAKRIPELARSLGKASREFERARNGLSEELKKTESAGTEEKKSEENGEPEK